MTVRREPLVAARLLAAIRAHPGADPAQAGGPGEPIVPGSRLTRRTAVALFESALQSRLQDLEARRLKDRGEGFYTIGSSGHEANAVFGALLRTTDPALLHYRSGAFLAARQRQGRGETPLFDAMLSFTASAEDPVSGGRHKVLGSSTLWVPPQTSTIASHLPKAAGMAFALERMARLRLPLPIPADSVVYCSFGDASCNHATAQSGFTMAAAAALHALPCPVLFCCEDNGIGISTPTPRGYVARAFAQRAGLAYLAADGRDLTQTFDRAAEAIEQVRARRRPLFFHLATVRLLGHAGTDLEHVYRSEDEIEADEARDPLLAFADLLLRSGALSSAELLAMHADFAERVRRCAEEAVRRPKLGSAAAVMAPLRHPEPAALRPPVADPATRLEVFRGQLPEQDPRPRHLAFRLAQGLKDLLAAVPQAFVFGEDVGRRGGVYNVTDGLQQAFGRARVFDTILDETSILGLAQAFGTLGALPVPEIQYLAYVHNALDQIRGEAASLQYFSAGRWRNPMLVRIAGFGYQKGFGGHFHNDNSVGALLDIPGLVIAAPARADDTVGILRTLAAVALQAGKVCILLEPIALYMTKDLHEKGDGLWQFSYPPPDQCVPLGEPRLHGASEDDELTIASYANGLYMSLQAQRLLRAQGVRARVLDLRWLAPLPVAAVKQHARATGRLLVVDECRATGGGPSALLLAACAEDPELEGVPVRRIASQDTYVPLGPAANLVMVQTEDIVAAALALARETVR